MNVFQNSGVDIMAKVVFMLAQVDFLQTVPGLDKTSGFLTTCQVESSPCASKMQSLWRLIVPQARLGWTRMVVPP